ncbi:hypothetical protein M758_UG121100 [Ceratodon purpureus]|nr:hypothetical protein M758_UG121100 [Ceratodon purpureus]
MHGDRTIMIGESQSEIEKIDSEELSLRARIEERLIRTESLGSGEKDILDKQILVAELSSDKGRYEVLCASRFDEQRRCKWSRQIVDDCEKTISGLEKELDLTCDEHRRLEQKVEAGVGQLIVIEEQLQMMKEGFEDSFWPVPIAKCPEEPVHLVHTLNPCPVCHLWYSCWDYVPLGCGHCYHPWCLASHAKASAECLVADCEKRFLRRHQIALGIRAPVKPSTITVKKEVLQTSHSFRAAHDKIKEGKSES